MKKKATYLAAILTSVLLPVILIAQPLPYDPNIGGGEGFHPVGGGAPLGEGLIVLLSMGVWYGVKKWKAMKDSTQ